MLPTAESVPENGEISTSSSQVPDPPSPKADRNNNRDATDILETELVCDESFSEIIKEDEEESVSSDSLNERKRLRTEEEEDGDVTEALSDVNKLRRIHEEEGKNELDGQNGNQDSEQRGNQESEVADEKEGENQENNNGEEDKNEETEEEKEEETEELLQCSTAEEGGKSKLEEDRENAGGEDNVNRINSEQNERGEEEPEQNEGKEDGENGEKEEEEKETEEEKGKTSGKGKRSSLVAIVPNFSKFERGECSYTPKEDQAQNSLPKDDTAFIDHELNDDDDYDYHRDLAILRSMWHFKCNNGHLPYAHSDELHNHIMDSIPNLKILGNDLTEKIGELEENFYTARILDGDNPEMPQPIEREIFDFSMRLWGNSEDNIGNGI